MTDRNVFPARPATPAIGPGAGRVAAILLLAQFVAMWGAFFILAPAIDWPASLGEPAAVVLPLIRAQSGPVFAGYLFYLGHALLLVPLAVLLRHALGLPPALGGVAQSLGVLAGFAKALGISRWLVLMPGLAETWAKPGISATELQVLARLFDAFNAYAGGIGELLGVGLLAGTWTLLLSLALLRQAGAARHLGAMGLVAGLLLLATLGSVAGLDSPLLLTGSGIVWQLWTAALAVWLLRRR